MGSPGSGPKSRATIRSELVAQGLDLPRNGRSGLEVAPRWAFGARVCSELGAQGSVCPEMGLGFSPKWAFRARIGRSGLRFAPKWAFRARTCDPHVGLLRLPADPQIVPNASPLRAAENTLVEAWLVDGGVTCPFACMARMLPQVHRFPQSSSRNACSPCMRSPPAGTPQHDVYSLRQQQHDRAPDLRGRRERPAWKREAGASSFGCGMRRAIPEKTRAIPELDWYPPPPLSFYSGPPS